MLDDFNEPYRSLDDIPEMVRLYAEISCDDDKALLTKANNIRTEAIQYDGRNNRPIHIKRSFEAAVKHLTEPMPRPVNDGLVADTKMFFALAVAGGFTTKDDLRKFMEDDVDFIPDLAAQAKSQRIMNEERRAIGRKIRAARKAIANGDGPSRP